MRGSKYHTASVDSIDYDLTSSDEENDGALPDKSIGDNLEISIARDRSNKQSPGNETDMSDAKTSDITKISHVKEVAGITYEKAPSVSASQQLDTRSDLS